MLDGLRFDPVCVPRHRLRCRLLLNGELVLVFVSDITDSSTSFVCVVVWTRIGWEKVMSFNSMRCTGLVLICCSQVVICVNRSVYDAAWLARRVLAVASDADGLETHEVTMIWPLVVTKRAGFYLPDNGLLDKTDQLALTVSSSVTRPAARRVGRRSFYLSQRAHEHHVYHPRMMMEEEEGIVVLAVRTRGFSDIHSRAYVLVASVSFIMTLALCDHAFQASIDTSSP